MATDDIAFLVTAQNASSAAFKEVSADLDNLVKGMGAVVSASAAVVAAGVAIASQYAQMADELDNNATILNVNAQTLRDWQHTAVAANIGGDQLIGMLEKLSRNAGEAARGNKPLIESFASIGISQEDLAGKLQNLEQLYPAVLDGIRNLGTGYQQVAALQDVLGRGSVGLTSVVRQSKEAMAEATEAFHRNAGVLTNEQVRAVADANDKWELFLDTLKQKGLTIFAQITEALEKQRIQLLTEKLADLKQQAAEAADPTVWESLKNSIAAAFGGGVTGGQTQAFMTKEVIRQRVEATQKLIDEVTAEIAAAKKEQEQPAGPVRDGGGTVTDPTLAAKVAAAQAAAAEIRSIDALQTVSEQIQSDARLAAAQTEADERVRILQGLAVSEKIINDKRVADEKKASQQKAIAQTQYYLQMLAGASGYNKTFFEIAKVAAIANATISTYQGAAQALKDVPYPYNIAAAAAVVVAGVAQIAQIASTSYGATATPTQSSGPGGFGTSFQPGQLPAPFVATPAESQQQGRTLTVVVQGDGPLTQQIAQSLRVHIDSTDDLLFSANSRQAAEIRGG